MSWTWGASSSFTEFTFPRRVCFSPRSPGGIRGIKRFGEVAESTPNGHGRFIPWAPLAHAVDTDEMLQAVIDFLHLWREQAPSKVPTTWGTIYRDERFPLIHEANLGGCRLGRRTARRRLSRIWEKRSAEWRSPTRRSCSRTRRRPSRSKRSSSAWDSVPPRNSPWRRSDSP